uniref:Si:ch211-241f5.3 n=1 Tax=Hucho hucho TaxID=62062 RepID=A0A4W5LGN9_9TELE
VAGLLHFFFLAAFCWMCLEGVQLFRMVVLVFNTTFRPLYMMAGGYGVPAVIVIISASANAKGYGTDCWLNLEDGFIWSFFGPVCIIIMVRIIDERWNSFITPTYNVLAFTITAVAQLCVLGTLWIFGFFQFEESTLAMSYLFTILNSLQGVLVFFMHCLLSKQVRHDSRLSTSGLEIILEASGGPNQMSRTKFGLWASQKPKGRDSALFKHSPCNVNGELTWLPMNVVVSCICIIMLILYSVF